MIGDSPSRRRELGSPRVGSGIELLLLAAAAATLWLPAAAAGWLLLVLGALWQWGTEPGRGRSLVAAGLVLCGLSLVVGPWLGSRAERTSPDDLDILRARYEALWSDLERAAERTAANLPAWDHDSATRLPLFQYLQQEVESLGVDPAVSLLVFDAGDTVAWAGPGLLHEPEAYQLGSSGAGYRMGHTAGTLYAVARVADRKPVLRVVAGVSLPLSGEGLLPPRSLGRRIWLGPPGVSRDGVVEIALADRPSLYLGSEPRGNDETGAGLPSPRARRWIEGLLGLVLWAAASLRLAGWRRRPRLAPAPLAGHALVLGVGTAVLARSVGVSSGVALALALGLALLGWSARLPRSRGSRWEGVLGAGVGLGLLGSGLPWIREVSATGDLAETFFGNAEAVLLRLALFLLVLGILVLAGRRRASGSGSGGAGAALALILAAAAVHDHRLPALVLTLAAGAAAGAWLQSVEWRSGSVVLGPLALLAALIAATGWQASHRQDLRYQLQHEYLPRVGPADREEQNDLLIELEEELSTRDLADLELGVGEVESEDLAFVLWKQSGLARRDGLSALVIEPLDRPPSSFAFGLALDDNLEVIIDRSSWRVPESEAWYETMIFGESELHAGGEPWGRARYAFLPRPGFRLPVNEVDELESALVRGNVRSGSVDGLPRPALYALYDPEGRALSSPWDESPPLDPGFLAGASPSARLETPSGVCWAWKREAVDGIEVIYLPRLGALAALERVGIQTLGALFVVGLLGALALLVALPRIAFRQWFERTVRSYAKRLVLVYTVLLLVPLIALNLILLRGFENRLREDQRADARAAIASARQFLVDYLLGLEPGFGIDTQINRALMEWISGVVQHQVNLYWGSQVLVSSQEELFTAGLLPRRIPGEVFSRLALLHYELGTRTQEASENPYLELYAPLDVPGLAFSQRGLFLSVPLIEQEEEVIRELASSRRRAVLVTTALFVLLLWVGSRLAHRFTTPIMALIEGTRNIARGAPFLGVKPREEELSALATAIDDMARRIAQGRRRLVKEKQLVERIVENITSGVVSLDSSGRVVLRNRVAVDLLGADVGSHLPSRLAQEERLSAVAELVGQMQAGVRKATLRVQDPQGDDRDWTLIWVPLGEGEESSALLVVDDATEVLRGQRLEAWAEMARIIAHEIKNPLTPIRLSTEHMQLVYRDNPDAFGPIFDRCTGNILKQVEELRDLASDFSIYSRIPRAELVAGDLLETLREVTEIYRDASRGQGVEIRLRVGSESLLLRFDAKLLSRALRNLIENALRANAGQGEVEILAEQEDEEIRIRVLDDGPGVEPKMLQRIFEPYFSTYDTGTGLGLAITRRIVEEHGGQIEAHNREPGGLEVVLVLPRDASALDASADGKEQSEIQEPGDPR